MTSVDIGDVTLTYRGASGGVLALQGTSLNVRRGEFAAVVGPSGCGKSSLMKLVTGLIPPDNGSIVISGAKVTRAGQDRRDGVPEPEPAAWRKVIDNVCCRSRSWSRTGRISAARKQTIARRPRRCSRPSGSTALATVTHGSSPAACSSARRSAARSSIEPSLLMLDEPFAALDAFTREELWCVLRDLWQKINFTVILVTHDLREAAFLADTIHVMSARPGHIVMSKTVELPRPRELEDCFEPQFIDIVHELRAKIGEVRQGMNSTLEKLSPLAVHHRAVRVLGSGLPHLQDRPFILPAPSEAFAAMVQYWRPLAVPLVRHAVDHHGRLCASRSRSASCSG